MPRLRTKQWGPEPYIPRIHKRMARGASLEEAADQIGIPLWLAKAVFVRSGLPVPKPLRKQRVPNAAAQEAFSEVAALLALRLLSHELGAIGMARGPVIVTKKVWDSHRDPSQHPSSGQLIARYGTWSAACEAAGVPVRRPRRD